MVEERRKSDATAAVVLLPSGSDVPAAPLSSEGRGKGGVRKEVGGGVSCTAARPIREPGAMLQHTSAAAATTVAERALPGDIEPSLSPPPPPSLPSLPLFPTNFSKLIFHPPTRFHHPRANLFPFFYSSLSSFSSPHFPHLPSPLPPSSLTHGGQRKQAVIMSANSSATLQDSRSHMAITKSSRAKVCYWRRSFAERCWQGGSSSAVFTFYQVSQAENKRSSIIVICAKKKKKFNPKNQPGLSRSGVA